MRRLTPLAPVLVLAVAAAPVYAGGFNTTYLVPAYTPCPGPDICGGPPTLESTFTFDSATLRSPRSPFTDPKKPSLIVELKGVKDSTGNLVTDKTGFTIQVAAGQVNLFEPAPGFSLPAGHPLTQIAPIPIGLSKGHGKLAYTPPTAAPAHTVTEGGAVTIYDSAGKRLATVGARYR
jgi:hypothetical protein